MFRSNIKINTFNKFNLLFNSSQVHSNNGQLSQFVSYQKKLENSNYNSNSL